MHTQLKRKTEHVSVVSTKTPKVNVTVTEKQCRFLLDTGATVSLLDQKTHDRIWAPKLTREKNPNLLPYRGGSSIKVMGQCKLTVETKHSINYNTFYVVEETMDHYWDIHWQQHLVLLRL
jgi:hypothetical protein